MPPHFTCCSTFVESIETTPSKAQKKVAKISGILPIYLHIQVTFKEKQFSFPEHSKSTKMLSDISQSETEFTTAIGRLEPLLITSRAVTIDFKDVFITNSYKTV